MTRLWGEKTLGLLATGAALARGLGKAAFALVALATLLGATLIAGFLAGGAVEVVGAVGAVGAVGVVSDLAGLPALLLEAAGATMEALGEGFAGALACALTAVFLSVVAALFGTVADDGAAAGFKRLAAA